MRRSSLVPILLIASLVAGCATPRPPAEFSLARTRVIAADSGEPLVLEGNPGKGDAAAAGAAAGAAATFAGGGAGCLATGPLLPVCLAFLVPVAAVTAAGTAAAGAIMADSAEVTKAKRDLLRAAMVPATAHGRLAQRVRERARARQHGAGGDAPAAPVRDWNLLVKVVRFDTVGTGADKPYALQAWAQLDVQRSESDQPSFTKTYRLISASKHTVAEWGANDGELVRSALDDLLNRIAGQMVAELAARAPQPGS